MLELMKLKNTNLIKVLKECVTYKDFMTNIECCPYINDVNLFEFNVIVIDTYYK
jgi:hypothetical protein